MAVGDDELLGGGALFDLRGGDHGRDADAAAEVLGQRDDVGHDALRLEREQIAELAQPGLLLVEN